MVNDIHLRFGGSFIGFEAGIGSRLSSDDMSPLPKPIDDTSLENQTDNRNYLGIMQCK